MQCLAQIIYHSVCLAARVKKCHSPSVDSETRICPLYCVPVRGRGARRGNATRNPPALYRDPSILLLRGDASTPRRFHARDHTVKLPHRALRTVAERATKR